MSDSPYLESALRVLKMESEAVASLKNRIDDSFAGACNFLFHCEGRVIVTGMGKSGHIGGKLAATLASTGTPAFFVHPGEASHGDLGMITNYDIVLALSNSGETPEVLTIVPMVKRMGVKLIAMTGNPESSLAALSDVHIDVGVVKEACPLNLAPTSSTTAALAMGDAIAVALLESRGFTSSDFAQSHPGGALGRRLLLYVTDIMHGGDNLPSVNLTDSANDAIIEMSSKGLGMTAVTDSDGKLCGVITDGDLRRALQGSVDVYQSSAADIMTNCPVTVGSGTLAHEVISIMRENSVNGVMVLDNSNNVVGALNAMDLLRAGIM